MIDMVGLVGYAPTTFRMSSEHSTIELKAQNFNLTNISNYLTSTLQKIFVCLFTANNNEKLVQKKVELKSEKNAPLGIIGIN